MAFRPYGLCEGIWSVGQDDKTKRGQDDTRRRGQEGKETRGLTFLLMAFLRHGEVSFYLPLGVFLYASPHLVVEESSMCLLHRRPQEGGQPPAVLAQHLRCQSSVLYWTDDSEH